ncbi:hypothetical protein [Sphingomonas sp. 3-13AW]|uniref:hypothetical protein n=1 Tax=Sphingomonas sp. 3-13AW TaxID=3050450 RepID=UPI003BB5E3ED
MSKLHLGATVPNEGARRLAAFVGKRGWTPEQVAAAARDEAMTIHRLIAGELTPGGDLAHRIWLATDGAVGRREWGRPPEGGWFDAVVARA